MTLPKHQLSKSTFMYGRQCALRLFLHKFHPELIPEPDEQQQQIFDQGTNVGLLAQQLFPGGVDASPADPYSYQKSVLLTKKLMLTNTVIYEAAFQYEGVLCAIDMLVQINGRWHAFEVKSTNSVKDPHKVDAALQYYVITQSGVDLADISIVHFNRNYVREGKLDIQQLFTVASVLLYAQETQVEIKTSIGELKTMLANRERPDIAPGAHCNSPYACPFIDYCQSLHPVTPEHDMDALRAEPTIYEKRALRQWTENLQFPLSYFDFETVMYGVPAFNQSSPYQAIPFQYALIRETASGQITEMGFLGDGKTDPRLALIEQMLRELGTKGSIIAWHMSYEQGIIRGLIRNFPQYAKPLTALLDRFVDLKMPFKNNWVHVPACLNSNSLKVVVPEFIPELAYHDLEIQEGMSASFMYSQLGAMPATMKRKTREDLVAYCYRDVHVMLAILEKIYAIL
jgi:hypothetical protein